MDAPGRHPAAQILPLDGRRHQFGKQVRGAGKGRDVQRGEGGGLEAYRTCVRQMRPALEALADEVAAEG